MAQKRISRKTRLRKWMDEQYRANPCLKARVRALVDQMSLEQDLLVLQEQRGLSQRPSAV